MQAKKIMLLAILLISLTAGFTQDTAVTSVDIVKVKNGYVNEATYFFENNWKLYRDSALANNFISGYRIMKTVADSAQTTFMLFTEYRSRQSYFDREKNFQPLMKKLRPSGPIYMNNLKRDDILHRSENFLMHDLFTLEEKKQ